MITAYQDAINNPDLAEPFIILRNPGQHVLGGWQSTKQQKIVAYGAIGLASQRQLQMVPEGDRVNEMRVFTSTTPMYVSSENLSITSDFIQWQGDQYRVMFVSPRTNRGYYSAVAARMAGQ